MPVNVLQVSQFLEELATSDIAVEQIAGAPAEQRDLSSASLHRPGLALVGHFFHHHPERTQVLGETETAFLNEQPPDRRAQVFGRLCDDGVPCFVITRGLQAVPELIAACNRSGAPLLRVELETGDFIRTATRILSRLLAPATVIHGVMMDVFGVGVLITGPSGIGKSESALELVVSGHRLVADDMVEVRQERPGELIGRSMELIKHHMEIRGLGIINVQDLFGVASVRDNKQLHVIINLEHWDPEAYYDRVGVDGPQTREILGIAVDHITIPVRPGRNLSDIIEVAARNRILKIRGIDSAERFRQKLLDEIAGAEPIPAPPEIANETDN